jgi:membrane protease YdiL (CAAX protease family)
MSLFAGVIGLGALVAFQKLWARLVPLAPEQNAADLSGVPLFSLVISLIMASIVAGVTEEAGFRGYMQGMIERRHGPVIAILVSGVVFGFAHFTHPQVGLAHMPYYIGASAVYGTLVYLTGSILPGVLLHAAGDAFEFLLLVAQGQNTPLAPAAQPLIWESGPDLFFWARCAWLALWVAGTIWSYRAVAREVRRELRTTESRAAASES